MEKITLFYRRICLMAIFMIVIQQIEAHDFVVDGIYYNISDTASRTVEVTHKGTYGDSYFDEYENKVSIPQTVTYNDTVYTVTGISNDAFYLCGNITDVVMPSTITYIGEWAFAFCSSLTTVTIPNAVTKIDEFAFGYCDELTSVVMGDSLNVISYGAFINCSRLKSAPIPNSVITIESCAFHSCSSLEEVIIPNSVETIGLCAFQKCGTLNKVTIGESVTKIGNNAFGGGYDADTIKEFNYNAINAEIECLGCIEKIGTLNFGDKVTTIPAFNFLERIIKIGTISIPNSVTTIADYAFRYAAFESQLIIPNSVTTIGVGAFMESTLSQGIRLGESVTTIGDYAFYRGDSGWGWVWNGIDIYIPKSLKYVGKGAFYNNYYRVHISDLSAWSNIEFANIESNPLYSPNSNNQLILNDTIITKLVIPADVTEIKAFTFPYCSTLKSVTIPSTVTSIGDNAFYMCENLTSVHIEDLESWCNIDFKDVFSNPLYYAENLYLNDSLITELNIPQEITAVKNFAFCGNKTLSTVNIHNSVTEIGESAFYKCENITDLKLGESVGYIGRNAFAYNYGLKNIYSANTAPPECYSKNVFNKVDTENCQLFVQEGCANVYAASDVWCDFANINESSSLNIMNNNVADDAGIGSVETDNNATEVARYDINGNLLSAPIKGINIVKMSDGSTRKEFVK